MGNDVKPKKRDRGNAWAGFVNGSLLIWCVGHTRSDCIKLAEKNLADSWEGMTFHRVRISRVD